MNECLGPKKTHTEACTREKAATLWAWPVPPSRRRASHKASPKHKRKDTGCGGGGERARMARCARARAVRFEAATRKTKSALAPKGPLSGHMGKRVGTTFRRVQKKTVFKEKVSKRERERELH